MVRRPLSQSDRGGRLGEPPRRARGRAPTPAFVTVAASREPVGPSTDAPSRASAPRRASAR
ncbi:hypothetical protein AB0H12_23240 [Actinosynnema sp. NPDC023794]